MRIRMTDRTAELTDQAEAAEQRFIKACREVLLGNPYDGEWLDDLRIAMDKAHDDLKASWQVQD